MRTTLLLLGSRRANLRRSWAPLQRQIELKGSPQALRHEVVERTRRGSGRDVGRILVSHERCPAICGHTSHPNSSASHPECDESQMENSGAGLLVGRRSTETCMID